MDRVQPSEGWGRTFESCLARQISFLKYQFFARPQRVLGVFIATLLMVRNHYFEQG